MSQIVGSSEYFREGQETRRSEQFAETPVPVRTGVNSAKSVNLAATAATANGEFVLSWSNKGVEPADKSFVTKFNLAAPSSAAGSTDLEWVVGFFQIKADEASVTANRNQIKQEQNALKPKHDRVIANIRLSVDAQTNSESAKELQKILGAVTAAIAVASAILSVFTFGIASIAGAAAIAAATLAVLGSVLSLSGGDEKVMDLLADLHKSCNSGVSDEDAEKFGQQFYSFFGMGLTLAVGITGSVGGVVSNVVAKGISEGTKLVCKITTSTLSFTSSVIESGGGLNSSIKNTTATIMQADLRLVEGGEKQQTSVVDQIANELDRSVELLFSHWGAFEEVMEEVVGAKSQLADSIADPAV